MEEQANILLADDELVFQTAAAKALRKKGYSVVSAKDAPEALTRLKEGTFDLLIADIRMPGNCRLQLIDEVRDLAPELPVIIVTGHASLESAVQSVSLSVVAYLMKPVDFGELLAIVRTTAREAATRRALARSLKRLQESASTLEAVGSVMSGSAKQVSNTSIEAFLALSHRNIVASLEDIERVTLAMSDEKSVQDSCRLLQCPRPVELTKAINEAISVLGSTKSSFKSKELGALRRRLKEVVTRWGTGS
ncbi:MAG: response regulator [Gammaproteobacteria bacterium]|nr:response regulator [Gammaproteobacteria bacterium]NIR82778.1 response regulator [Gammaproteobacteria bacterium]NIR89642.1 response regulator [Gammaproteobacteria bacterium]NIU03938.1 response regulator [Gammaproteobacteria bacterium]NIV51254.1 response regulator [Gammaproteobacteria bacterium]